MSAGRRPGLVGGNGEGYSVSVLRVRVDLAVPRGRDQTLSAGREVRPRMAGPTTPERLSSQALSAEGEKGRLDRMIW